MTSSAPLTVTVGPPPVGAQGAQGVPGMMEQQAHNANANGVMGGLPVAVGGGGVMTMTAGGHMGGLGGGVGVGGGRELLGQGIGVVGQHGGSGGGGEVGVAVMGGATLAPVKRRISREGGPG